jgi:hypothetical protein
VDSLRFRYRRVGNVLVEVDAPVGELSEGSLLLEFSGLFGILQCLVISCWDLLSWAWNACSRIRRQP